MDASGQYPSGCYLFVTKDSHASVPLLVGDTRRIHDNALSDVKMVALLRRSRGVETNDSPFKTYVVHLQKHNIVAIMMGPLVGSYDSVVREWLVELGISKDQVQITMYGLGYGLDYGIYG